MDTFFSHLKQPIFQHSSYYTQQRYKKSAVRRQANILVHLSDVIREKMKSIIPVLLSLSCAAGLQLPAMDVLGSAISPNLYFDHKLGSYYAANTLVAENIPASYCREETVAVLIWIGAVSVNASQWIQLQSVAPPVSSLEYSGNNKICQFNMQINILRDGEMLNPILNQMNAVLYFKQSPTELLPSSSVPITPHLHTMGDTILLHQNRDLGWSDVSWRTEPDISTRPTEQRRLVAAVQHALDTAYLNQSRATGLRKGYGGVAFRHFMNAMGSIADVRYLEVGTFNGTSLFSFVEGNHKTIGKVVAIDSWDPGNVPYSEDNVRDIRDGVIAALELYEFDSIVTVIERDCWQVNAKEVIAALGGKAHVYFYDAGHSASDHYAALPQFLSVMENTFVLIVDDWSWTSVKRGTYSALRSLPLEVIAELSIDTIKSEPHFNLQWHNGVGVFVINKMSQQNN